MQKIRKKIIDIINNIYNRNITTNEIDYEQVKSIIRNNIDTVLVDIRSPQEYKELHLEGAINLPLHDLERNPEKYFPNKEENIILYCQSGIRSKSGVEFLIKKGYKNVYDIKGGLDNI